LLAPARWAEPSDFRFWIFDFRLELELDSKDRLQNFLFMDSAPQSKIGNLKSKIHLITRSALAKTFGGIVRPICFAALRLITKSNLVGCSIGRSAV
jgi:hypothetical protein